jgi:hypothetical protein
MLALLVLKLAPGLHKLRRLLMHRLHHSQKGLFDCESAKSYRL